MLSDKKAFYIAYTALRARVGFFAYKRMNSGEEDRNPDTVELKT
jgi:hypothetical protein